LLIGGHSSQDRGEVREQSLGKATQWTNPTNLGGGNPVTPSIAMSAMYHREEHVCLRHCLRDLFLSLGEQVEVGRLHELSFSDWAHQRKSPHALRTLRTPDTPRGLKPHGFSGDACGNPLR